MLSLSLSVNLLAPLGCTEAELVAGLCAKLRTLAADPVRVAAEMQGGLTLTPATPEEWQRQSIDVLGRSESATESDSGLQSSLPPAGGVQKGTCVGPCNEPTLIQSWLAILKQQARAGRLTALDFKLLADQLVLLAGDAQPEGES